MVQITIDLDIKLDLDLQSYMIEDQDGCLNKNGNVDKRIAIVKLLRENLDSWKEFMLEEALAGRKLKEGRKFETSKNN